MIRTTLAFASCMNAVAFKEQPVWDWIAQWQPQDLLLLGDSIYLDGASATNPRDMSADEFRQHVCKRYRLQLAQPQFAALLQRLGPGHVDALWDDHDFLWDQGAGVPVRASFDQRDKLPVTTACFNAFRLALSQGTSYPASDADPSLNLPHPKEPDDLPPREVAPGVWLHLTDGRSWRTYEDAGRPPPAERQMFGARQLARLQKDIEDRAGAIHLFASGSALKDWRKAYGNDWVWLRNFSRRHRILVLSGDIHENSSQSLDSEPAGELPLHEATSSGAAAYKLVDFGPRRRNFGILQIEDARLVLRLFKDGQQQQEGASFAIDRASWRRLAL